MTIRITAQTDQEAEALALALGDGSLSLAVGGHPLACYHGKKPLGRSAADDHGAGLSRVRGRHAQRPGGATDGANGTNGMDGRPLVQCLR
jgi:hypothetical protein